MIYILIVIVIILAINIKKYIQKRNTEENSNTSKIIEIEIIDKENNMQNLYENPEKEEYVEVDIIIDGIYYKNVGIRTKGSSVYRYISSNNNGKNLYSFKAKLDYINKNQNYNGITELYLNRSVYDKTKIREFLAYDLYNDMGIKSQSYFLGNLKINNESLGLKENEIDGRVFIAKLRYRHNGTKCKIMKNEDGYSCILEEPVRAITKGQSAVFYDDNDKIMFGSVIK